MGGGVCFQWWLRLVQGFLLKGIVRVLEGLLDGCRVFGLCVCLPQVFGFAAIQFSQFGPSYGMAKHMGASQLEGVLGHVVVR